MICPTCKGKGKAVHSCETHPDENSVTVHLFEDICHTCHGSGRKPQTNADRIRSLSDEDLADHNIHTVKVWNRYEGYHEIEYRCSDGYTTGIYDFALRHELDWLKQPVKDGEDEWAAI